MKDLLRQPPLYAKTFTKIVKNPWKEDKEMLKEARNPKDPPVLKIVGRPNP